MLTEIGPRQYLDDTTGTMTVVVDGPDPRVEVCSPDGTLSVLRGEEADHAVDHLQVELIVQWRERRARRRSEPLWGYWTGFEIPYRLTGTVELLNGEERVPALNLSETGPFPRVTADGRCACRDCD